MLKQLFTSLTEQNKEKRKESRTKTCNKRGVYQRLGVTFKCWLTPKSWPTPEGNLTMLRKITFFPGVDQLLGVNQCLRETPKRWQNPFYKMFFFVFFVYFYIFWRNLMEKVVLASKKQKQMISASKRCAEHPFSGRNTQHIKISISVTL